jgi:hypothetical protein
LLSFGTSTSSNRHTPSLLCMSFSSQSNPFRIRRRCILLRCWPHGVRLPLPSFLSFSKPQPIILTSVSRKDTITDRRSDILHHNISPHSSWNNTKEFE